jgi:hypothetical protein
MNKVSKGLFLGSVGIGFGIAVVLLILGKVQFRTGSARAGLLLTGLSCVPNSQMAAASTSGPRENRAKKLIAQRR